MARPGTSVAFDTSGVSDWCVVAGDGEYGGTGGCLVSGGGGRFAGLGELTGVLENVFGVASSWSGPSVAAASGPPSCGSGTCTYIFFI